MEMFRSTTRLPLHRAERVVQISHLFSPRSVCKSVSHINISGTFPSSPLLPLFLTQYLHKNSEADVYYFPYNQFQATEKYAFSIEYAYIALTNSGVTTEYAYVAITNSGVSTKCAYFDTIISGVSRGCESHAN
jgi:hypothetical protein